MDLDQAVLKNRASDEQLLMKNGELNIPNNSIDLIIADYVLEHIDDPKKFAIQIDKCLKSGGWFCARTPHKFSYVAFAASLIKNSAHSKVLNIVQPGRKEIDVFPTKYKMNTLSDFNKYFNDWSNHSFIFRSDPAYYFGSKLLYRFQSILHRLLPASIIGNLFIFVRKP